MCYSQGFGEVAQVFELMLSSMTVRIILAFLPQLQAKV